MILPAGICFLFVEPPATYACVRGQAHFTRANYSPVRIAQAFRVYSLAQVRSLQYRSDRTDILQGASQQEGLDSPSFLFDGPTPKANLGLKG